jgi:8-oxoguanine DNA-glycosylase Ogg
MRLASARRLLSLRPPRAAAPARAPRAMAAAAPAWTPLRPGGRTPAAELRLEHTLPTGQSFRWRAAGEGEFRGVVGARAVALRQLAGDVEYLVLARGAGAAASGDAAALADYFNLSTPLAPLAARWAAADARFAALAPHLPGARMLRQDPVECLLSFVCSQNNHISRIHGMVSKLAARYGTPLVVEGGAAPLNGGAHVSTEAPEFHAFPTLEQLGAATEEELRAAGFGYRAKFIVGAVAQLAAQEGGGAAWLRGLRAAPAADAAAALTALPGVGPKVAACVALFALDKHGAIPVDVHVWSLAQRYYAPQLRGKSLTPKLHGVVQEAFQGVFGEYAGWAHNTLFIGELATTKKRLAAAAAAAESASSDGEEDAAAALALHTPEGAAPGKRRRRPTPRVLELELAAAAGDSE